MRPAYGGHAELTIAGPGSRTAGAGLVACVHTSTAVLVFTTTAAACAVTEHDTAAGASELVQRLYRFAVDEMALSGCALALMSGAESRACRPVRGFG
jgi:hypothetical protein